MKIKSFAWFFLLAILLTGCEKNLLPDTISDRANYIVKLWNISMIGVIIVGATVIVLISYSIVRYGILKNKEIKKSHGDVKLFRESTGKITVEIIGSTIPILIVIFLFIYTMFTQIKVDRFDQNNNGIHVGVIARQWSWTFNYNYDDFSNQPKVYDIGDRNNMPSLYIPVNVPVNLYLYSPDVIHSFWVPELLYKLDVIPNRENRFQFTANKEGVFNGKCAELCGLNHTFMLFKLHVVSKNEYNKHMEYLELQHQNGSLITKSEFPIIRNQRP